MNRLFDRDLVITSGYKTQARPDHRGIDLRVEQGSKLYAFAAAIVHQEGLDSTKALTCELRIGDKIYQYGHLSKTVVSVGQQVVAGQLIGYSGGTQGTFGAGNSTGPHLHFEIFGLNKVREDPTAFVKNLFNNQPNITPPSAMQTTYTLQSLNDNQTNYVSHVVAELLREGVWFGQLYDGKGNQLIQKFQRLNPDTPKGGYKNGHVVIVGEATPVNTPPVIEAPFPETPEIDYKQIEIDRLTTIVNNLEAEKASLTQELDELERDSNIEIEKLKGLLSIAEEEARSHMLHNQSLKEDLATLKDTLIEVDYGVSPLQETAVEKNKDSWSWNKFFVGLSRFGVTEATLITSASFLIDYLNSQQIDNTTLGGAILSGLIILTKGLYQSSKAKPELLTNRN